VPDVKDILNALQALFEAVGENGTRAEIMEFWAKFNSDQLTYAEQFARGLTKAGTNYRGGSTGRQQLLDVIRDDDAAFRPSR
jgi:hypothetical protein